MKKFLLTLAVAALACSAMIAQNNTTSQEEPDRVQMRHLAKDPSGMDIPTGYDKAQVVDQKKHECKDHKDGQPCTKPADQQCPDCKAKAAAAPKHECKDGQKCEKGMKHECKDGQKCEKGMKHECKDGQKCEKGMKHECKEGNADCKKAAGMKHECKEGKADCKKAAGMKHECKEGMKDCKKAEGKHCDKAVADKKDCCKDKKMEGQKCDKPADQQCPDCKEKAAKKK